MFRDVGVGVPDDPPRHGDVNHDESTKKEKTMSFYSIKTLSPEIKLAIPSENSSKIATVCKEYNSGLVVLPTCTITGSTARPLFSEKRLTNSALSALALLCKELRTNEAVFAVGLPLVVKNNVENLIAYIFKGKVYGFVTQNDIDCMTVFEGYEVPVAKNIVFDIGGATLASVVAVDFYDGLCALRTVAQNADVVAYHNASPYTVGCEIAKKDTLKAISKEFGTTIAYVNSGFGESTGESVYAADNFVVQCGELLAEAELFTDGIVLSEADLGWTEFVRKSSKTNGNQSNKTITITQQIHFDGFKNIYSRTPYLPKADYPFAKNCIAAQSVGLATRIKVSGAKSLVLGLSGGLDSATAALVCREAAIKSGLSLDNVFAFSLPCFGTGNRTRNNSKLLANALDFSFKEVDITSSVTVMLKELGHDGKTADTAFENIQSRARTVFLLSKANMTGGIVVGTGDLSEEALGFCTYGGDQLFNYGVNASIMKTALRRLVSEYSLTAPKAVAEILTDILNTPISPELLPAKDGEMTQHTEDIVGPYELHDFFIFHKLTRGANAEKILTLAKIAFDGTYDVETIKKWLNTLNSRFYVQQFKRAAAPEGVAVTEISLSPRDGYYIPGDIPSSYSEKL